MAPLCFRPPPICRAVYPLTNSAAQDSLNDLGVDGDPVDGEDVLPVAAEINEHLIGIGFPEAGGVRLLRSRGLVAVARGQGQQRGPLEEGTLLLSDSS